MQEIQTLTSFFQQAKCNVQIFDLGRRVQPVSNDEFARIEANHIPYPYPVKGQGQFALIFNQDNHEPWIWFLRFPLDERGLLKQAHIGDFLRYVLAAFGTDLNQPLSEKLKEQLANNPYTFKPQDDKLAIFHALMSRFFKREYSSYYEPAREYLSGKTGWTHWQHIGFQGMADICVNLDKDDNTKLVRTALTDLPFQPMYALLACLEHVELPESIAKRLAEFIEQSPQMDLFFLCAVMRALSGARKNFLQGIISQVLNTENLCHREMFIAIAGRCWSALDDQKLMRLFLLRLAQNDEQNLFNQIFVDLVTQPSLRISMLILLREQNDSELEAAFLQLQKATRH